MAAPKKTNKHSGFEAPFRGGKDRPGLKVPKGYKKKTREDGSVVFVPKKK